MICTHERWEKLNEADDGKCPLCLDARLDKVLEDRKALRAILSILVKECKYEAEDETIQTALFILKETEDET